MSELPTGGEDITRPTRATVNLDAIAHNYRQFCAHAGGAKVMPVVKANAYGHGLVEVAQHLRQQNPPYFGVATFEEALALRDAGIDSEILVFGGMCDEQIPLYIQRGLTLTASSVSKLKSIESAAAQLQMQPRVHLKIDTGMERVGVHHYNAETLIEQAGRCRHADVIGLYTHFATADDADRTFFNLQLERFHRCCQLAKRQLGDTLLCHAANSAATLKYPESHFDMVRIGIALYGVLPSPEMTSAVPLRAALRWTSKVVYFKVVAAHAPVSYGGDWAPSTDTRVVTVPVGYADGYSRQLSNRAQVRINGRLYPVVGKVCMDQLMVNIGDDSAFNGDDVELLSPSVDAHQLASWQSTIAYEVLTRIGARVPRKYLYDSNPQP